MYKIKLEEFLKPIKISDDLKSKSKGLEISYQDAIVDDPMKHVAKIEIYNPVTDFHHKDAILESDKYDVNIWQDILSNFLRMQ